MIVPMECTINDKVSNVWAIWFLRESITEPDSYKIEE